MYKKALQHRLRFETSKGILTTEQLFGLSMAELKTLILKLHDVIKKDVSEDLDFLNEDNTTEESDDELRYNVAVDVFKTKQAEVKDAKNEAERRAHNKHIDEIIAAKEEENLRNMSIEDLKKLKK